MTLVDEIVQRAQQAGFTLPSEILGVSQEVVSEYRAGQAEADRRGVRIPDWWVVLIVFNKALDTLSP